MYYDVPREPPAAPEHRPRPIFPWEGHQPPPSRVFAIEEPATLESSGQFRPSGADGAQAEPAMTETSSTEHKSEPATPTTPLIRVVPSDPWSSFTRTNAWDDVPEIERYVDTLQGHRRTRSHGTPRGGVRMGGGDLRLEGQAEFPPSSVRHGSRVTNFPSEIERPSLPVTPAPIRRPMFWGSGGPGFGDEGDDDDQLLPAAEGVPQQTDWVCVHGLRWNPADCLCDLTNVLRYHKDPVAQLQKLARQQSEMLLQKLGGEADAEGDEGDARGHERREIPSRPQPFGSEDLISPTYVAQSSTVLSPQPVKPGAAKSAVVRNFLSSEEEATPRIREAATTSATIPEPSYTGPGLAWEKDEGYPEHSITAAPPNEAEKDVLET